MTKFFYNSNEFTHPFIDFNDETGIFEIKGNSIMLNPYVIYEKLLEWLDNYIKNPKETTILNIKLSALNTRTSFYLLEIFKKLIKIQEKQPNYKVIINWYSEDEDMYEAGETYNAILTSYKNELKINFNLINTPSSEQL